MTTRAEEEDVSVTAVNPACRQKIFDFPEAGASDPVVADFFFHHLEGAAAFELETFRL